MERNSLSKLCGYVRIYFIIDVHCSTTYFLSVLFLKCWILPAVIEYSIAGSLTSKRLLKKYKKLEYQRTGFIDTVSITESLISDHKH